VSAQAIGLDIGGTKIAGVRIDAEGAVLGRGAEETPADDPPATVAAVLKVARGLLDAGVSGVGIGAAGLVDLGGTLRFAPNLVWRDVALPERVGGELGLPTVADNDANAAAWGEYRFGAARTRAHALVVTVGTGIGGGIISEGRLARGANGFAAEIGHIVVEPGGPLCGCGNRGCWEQVASGHAIGRAGREAATRHPHSLVAELAGGDPGSIDGPLVSHAAREGDKVAVGILSEVGRRLGQGIAGLVNILDPEVVVVGGGVAEVGELLLAPARRAMGEAIEAPKHRPEVPLLAAELGNDAGAIGAAALGLEAR